MVGANGAVTTQITHEALLTKFEAYCVPKRNETYERYVFRQTMQKPLEPMDKFITTCKTRVKTCNYGTLSDSMVRDQIILGVVDDKLKEKLLREDNLTLTNAEKMCYAAEVISNQMKELKPLNAANGNSASKIEEIKVKPRKKASSTTKTRKVEDKSTWFDCRNCATRHAPRNCPAYQTKCSKCSRYNHFPSCCRTKKIDAVGMKRDQPQQRRKTDTSDDSDEYEQEFIIHMMNGPLENATCEWKAQVSINNSLLSLKVDTGAQCNVISLGDLNSLSPRPDVRRGKVKLTSYQGVGIPCEGVCILTIQTEGGDTSEHFVVVPSEYQSILGLSTSLKLGIVEIPDGNQFTRHELVSQVSSIVQHKIESKQVESPAHFKGKSGPTARHAVVSTVFGKDISNEVFQKYPKLFEGVGSFGEPYEIKLKDEYTPVITPVRRVHFSRKKAFRQALDAAESLGVVSKVEHPTEFVNSVVLTAKPNGEVRFCLDPRGLNKAIRREPYPILTREEIFAELAGAKFFTQLDLKSAYWQMPLHEDSKDLTTFGTPFGRYRYNVVPFGINSASDLCQNRVEKHLVKGESNVLAHQDNILIWGEDALSHDRKLEQVLQNAAQCGATFNPDKCEFRVTRTVFLGEILTPDGILPDDSKVRDVQLMESPENVEQLRSVLGMINFFSKFIPNLSARTQCMRSLLSKDVVWSWDANHRRELDDLKEVLTSSPILSLFDPAKQHKVSADSSKGGIGAALLQLEDDGWHPVAYASRALIPTEQEYVQIEKEALAVTWGMLRFDQYLGGLRFQVETDNKPLFTLYERPLVSVPARIQSFMLKTQQYDFEVEWVPRRFMHLADSLSKVYKRSTSPENSSSRYQIDSVIQDFPVSDEVWDKIRKATADDPSLQQIIRLLKDGNRLPGKYNDYVHELHIKEGVLIKGRQVVIPSCLRGEMLQKVHEGHMGVVKLKRRARASIYWPGMGRDISDMAEKCRLCMENQKKQAPQPLTQEIQTRPWHKVAADIFSIGSKDYLLVIDYFSNYPEVMPLRSKHAGSVIQACKAVFSRHGIPVKMTSDNVPFDSFEFREFAQHYGFSGRTTSPNHPSSNGKAEKGVQIVKAMMKKCYNNGEDAFLALLNYRTTALDCGKSPAQLLMGRQLKTRLPEVYMDRPSQDSKTMRRIMESKNRQKSYFDKSSRPLSPLSQGQIVRIYDTRKGSYPKKGIVQQEHSHQSYNVLTEDGRTLRRNRAHLRTTQEPFVPTPDYDDISVTAVDTHTATNQTPDQDTTDRSGETVDQGPDTVPIESDQPTDDVQPVQLRRSSRVVKKTKRLIDEWTT